VILRIFFSSWGTIWGISRVDSRIITFHFVCKWPENRTRIQKDRQRVTHAFWLLSVFNPFIQQSCSLKKVQCLDDTDVFRVTWLHTMIPTCLNLIVAKVSQSQRMCEAVSDDCLGLFTCPSLNECPYKWQCSVCNLFNIPS
jgi:hypothetical protein